MAREYPFGQIHLAAHQRPVIREALAPAVAREDYERVVKLASSAQGLQ